MDDRQDMGVPPSGSGYSAEPEPSSTVCAVPVSIPNAALTEPQRRFLLTLPPNGEWKDTGSYLHVYRGGLRGFGQSGLIEGYYRERTKHRLTDAGREVAAALRAEQSERAGA